MVFRAIFDKVKKGLSKTREAFGGMASLFTGRGKVDQNFLDELERTLFRADLGTAATLDVVAKVRQAFLDKEISGDVQAFVRGLLRDMLATPEPINRAPSGPTVILIAGVNGSGKTTTIAKLANLFQSDGDKVSVAACDTFRAAAVDQLGVWCERIGCDITRAQPGSDPAAVAHDACEKAKARNLSIVIVDTAGRLHTQTHLMRELEKIRRVLAKNIEGAPHEVLLVLDATTGQNAIAQAEMFSKAIQCTGIVLTKLDGTAKGGAIFAIKQRLNLPVKFIGVGESMEDLQPFDPDTYVAALFE